MDETPDDKPDQGERAISLGGKLAFGVGATGEAVFLSLFNGFIVIYYNQVIGLANDLIGTAVMLSLIGDAITDPVVGIMSDRWRSRFGRRHPFLLAAPIPLVLTMYCIFQPPAALTAGPDVPPQTLLFCWLACWTILSRFFLTLYQVPHLALGGELTKDQNHRSQLFSANIVFNFVTLAVFAFVAWGYFFAGQRVRATDGELVPGQLDPASYGPLVLTACAVVMVTIWTSAAGTWKYIPNLSKAPSNQERMTPIRFLKAIGGTLKNPNYLVLLLGFFFFMITSGIYDTLEVLLYTHYWQLKPEQIKWFGLASAPAALAGAVLSPLLMRKFDRKPVMLTSLLGTLIFAQLTVDLRLMGLMFENGNPALLPILLMNRAGFAFTLGVGAVAVLSMIGDVIDDNELKTGNREEGLFYSARAFFAKASGSFGHFIAGIVLEHYVRMPTKAVPGQLGGDTMLRLGICAGPIMAIAGIISLFIYSRYNLSRERHQEITQLLKQRNAAVEQHSEDIGGDVND